MDEGAWTAAGAGNDCCACSPGLTLLPADRGRPLGAMGGGGAVRVGTGLVTPEEGDPDLGEPAPPPPEGALVSAGAQMGTSFVLRLTEDCRMGAEISRPRKLPRPGGALEEPPWVRVEVEEAEEGVGELFCLSEASGSGEAIGAPGAGGASPADVVAAGAAAAVFAGAAAPSSSSMWHMTASDVSAFGSFVHVGVTMDTGAALEVVEVLAAGAEVGLLETGR